MAKKRKKPTLSWEEAPDIIGVEELSEILGVGLGKASDLFNKKDFPKLPAGEGLKADKEAVRLFIQGFKIKDNPKTSMEYLILLELRKLNNYFERKEEDIVNE